MKINRSILSIFIFLSISGCANLDTTDDKLKSKTISHSFKNEKVYLGNNKIENIENIVESYLGEYKDNVGIYYYNLTTGDRYGLNEHKYYISASLKKVPQAMMILDLVNAEELSLDTIIYYNEEDYEGGTGILKNKKDIEPITIKEAIKLSIIHSDNIANNMLKRIGNKDVEEYTQEICSEEITPENNTTTAYQQFKIYERLYKNPEGNINYNYLIELLKKTAFHDRLDKYIPRNLVAHKIGNFYRYYDDAGIIYSEEPYILVVLTKDIGVLSEEDPKSGDENERTLTDDGKKACELIANISKKIYDISSEG